MASRKNRKTLKKQSKRVRGGDWSFLGFGSKPADPNAAKPADSTNGSWFSGWFSSKPVVTAPPEVTTPPAPPKGGKKSKTSKRRRRR